MHSRKTCSNDYQYSPLLPQVRLSVSLPIKCCSLVSSLPFQVNPSKIKFLDHQPYIM
uniref:Uncharacterized protein n=1 Tax=Rhizophora mucronata TaxID=61149 RepID=A0A2P2QZA9_RHIMU